jgi:hypothetical protein
MVLNANGEYVEIIDNVYQLIHSGVERSILDAVLQDILNTEDKLSIPC